MSRIDLEWQRRFRVPEHINVRRFDEEWVVLDLKEGKYFGLDELGGAIWQQMTAGKTPVEIVETILSTYQASREEIAKDVLRLLDDLLAAGLIESVESAENGN
jgi:hypothetical protein